ncbi:MAG: class I SAM-dependent methyltransferase [Pseudohaliea sp.]
MTLAGENLQQTLRPHNENSSATWSRGGGAYDEISRGILDAIEHAINRLEPTGRMRILDLATGTGWTARRLADRGYSVTGADFAPDMLASARELAHARRLAVPFVDGDAEALPFPGGSFDAVISTFGVMFTLRPRDAVAEMARVLRPGRKLVLTVWTADGNVFEMFKVIRQHMPPPEGQPPASPFSWGNRERLVELLGNDFELRFERGTSYYREPDGEAAWRTFVDGYGPVQALAGSLDTERRQQFESDFIAFHEQFRDELGITVPRDYLVVHGTRR